MEKKTLEEAYKRAWNYDPDDEELEKLYGKDFDDELEEVIKRKKSKMIKKVAILVSMVQFLHQN